MYRKLSVFSSCYIRVSLVALLLHLSMRHGACGETVIFERHFTDGTKVEVVQKPDEIKAVPLTEDEKGLAEEAAREGLVLGQFTGKALTCSVVVTQQSGKRKHVQKYVIDPDPPVSGTGPDWLYGFQIYDIVCANNELTTMYHNQNFMIIETLNLETVKLDINGVNRNAHAKFLFYWKWERINEGFLPIARAQIIPMKDGAYVFCVSNSGKCMLWEMRGEPAALVWTKTEGAIPEDAAPPQKQPPERKP